MNKIKPTKYRRFEISICKECGRINIWENIIKGRGAWREACIHPPKSMKVLYNRGPWVIFKGIP